MTLKTYSKGKINIKNKPFEPRSVEIKPYKKKVARDLSIWEIIQGSYQSFIDYLTFSKIAGLVVPIILIVTGAFILRNQLWGKVEESILERDGYFEQGTTPLVAGDYIEERQIYLSNPGSDYFRELADSAFKKNVLSPDPVSNNYIGRFTISIPSLNLENLPVTANVNSGLEEVYDRILNTTLAHMEGTGLPVSDVENNIVVYGHSANGDYFQRTQDPAGAFSRLQRIKFGDEITITMEGRTTKYKVSKTKIVNPDETSIITGPGGEQTLTLFTCFPNGNPSKRFVVIARPVGE
ncbi:MAG TPA: sortase [Candidatus Dojkabacteria bacterium]|jgi:LPXTG-site transpeptidase (sortase) family protein